MQPFVVDTNVLAVANRLHGDISVDCLLECVSILERIQKSGTLVLDDRRRILEEYLRVVNPGRQDGVGSVFLKWVLNNQFSEKVERVNVTEVESNEFAELQAAGFQDEIDPPDRKFIAVAFGARDLNPEILQAVDSEWLLWLERLRASGIKVRFLCAAEILKVFRRKFPQTQVPESFGVG